MSDDIFDFGNAEFPIPPEGFYRVRWSTDEEKGLPALKLSNKKDSLNIVALFEIVDCPLEDYDAWTLTQYMNLGPKSLAFTKANLEAFLQRQLTEAIGSEEVQNLIEDMVGTHAIVQLRHGVYNGRPNVQVANVMPDDEDAEDQVGDVYFS